MKKLFLIFTFLLLGAFGLFTLMIYQVDWWWEKANSQAYDLYKDKLICRKAYWSAFGELSLLDCHNHKQFWSSQLIKFQVFNGKLFLFKSKLKLQNGRAAAHHQIQIPELPAQIKQIKIENLQLVLPKPFHQLLAPDIKLIDFKRTLFSSKDWDLNLQTKNLQLTGRLGEKTDLTAGFADYSIQDNLLNGKLHLKTKNLFKAPAKLAFEELQVLSPGLSKPLKIKGGLFLSKSLQRVQSLQPGFVINLADLQLRNSSDNPQKFVLGKIALPKLKALLPEHNLKKYLNKGFLEAEIHLNLQEINKSSANLQFTEVEISQFQKIKGNLKLLPLVLLQNLAKIEPNFNLKTLCKNLGIENFQLILPTNHLFKGSVSGQINYQKNQDLKGHFALQNLAFDLPKEQLGIHQGNGQIQIANEKALVNLQALNAYSTKKEPINLEGNIHWFPSPKGKIVISVPQFTALKTDLSEEIPWVKARLKNLKSIIQISQKPVIQSLNGEIDSVILGAKLPNKPIELHEGKVFLDERNTLQIDNLQLGQFFIEISLPFVQNRLVPALNLHGKIDLPELKALLLPYKPELAQYDFSGDLHGKLSIVDSRLTDLDFNLHKVKIAKAGQDYLSSLNGKIYLDEKQQIVLQKINGFFNGPNKFQVDGHLSAKHYLPTLKINALVNPKNLAELLSKNQTSTIHFHEGIYVPVSIEAAANPQQELKVDFHSAFHKVQLFNQKIHFAPELDTFEYLQGTGLLNWQTKNFKLNNLTYSGKDFGVLVKAVGHPEQFDFSIESAPLIDLKEIATIWSEDAAAGRFRGKFEAHNFQPQERASWIKNLKIKVFSEENVDDFAYGILYGKYFSFAGETKDGNGDLALKVRKGKIKNLQITNLNSALSIKDGWLASLERFSLETADGKASLGGSINLASGIASLAGVMEQVNIETVSNNLFENAGDYNGKANLSYDLEGNFVDLLKASPPQKAKGEFALRDGRIKQISELSKGLHLANLIFGLPVRFSLETISHILQPSEDAVFEQIKGKWLFADQTKKIILSDTIYQGINALHLSLNGDWDFVNKNLDFDVYGFIPKKPSYARPNQSLMQISKKSRHFRFKIQGNIEDPSALENSVKRSIDFLWFPSSAEVKRQFKNL